MRWILAVGVLLVPLVVGTSTTTVAAATPPPTRLIIDTDFGQWWDDVAALAAVHAAADNGKASILGVVSNVDNPWNAPALDAINTWYGRPDIPIGSPAGAVPVEQNYSRYIAENFPHAGAADDAVALYRRLLEAQPDHSVTILSVGALTNLAQLVATDRALLARKVARTVIMGGEYPRASAPEWNFGLDLDATRQVVADWPTPIVYDGFEIGTRIFVGNSVCATHPASSPIRAAFDILYGCGNQQTDGTWDPTAAYYAVYGTDHVYQLAGQGGHNVVYPDGINAWAPQGHHQQYLTLTNPAQLTTALDALIDAQPATPHR
jgi:inosine-uridine nucleoside N-ribohydrolase